MSFSILHYTMLCPLTHPVPLIPPIPSPVLWFVRTAARLMDAGPVGAHTAGGSNTLKHSFSPPSPQTPFLEYQMLKKVAVWRIRLKHLEYSPWDQNSCFPREKCPMDFSDCPTPSSNTTHNLPPSVGPPVSPSRGERFGREDPGLAGFLQFWNAVLLQPPSFPTLNHKNIQSHLFVNN